jgi:ubiquinone/menaquinone biosynthesis C-methylase UbiE
VYDVSEDSVLKFPVSVFAQPSPIADSETDLRQSQPSPITPRPDTHIPKGTKLRKPFRRWIQAYVHGLLKKYSSVREDEIQALQSRVKAAEYLLDFVAADEINRWLYGNRRERMDATVPFFDRTRREFHLDRYRFASARVAGSRVLDCASGTGYGIRYLIETGKAASGIGVEIDTQAVEYALQRHRVQGAAFVCASGDCMPLPDACVDVVTSFETIEHVADDERLIDEFHRVLRPNGLLFISTPNHWPLAVSPYHVREYDKNSFLKVLDRYFHCLELYNQNSGSPTPYNHDQPAGIVATAAANEHLAECYLAVCRSKP